MFRLRSRRSTFFLFFSLIVTIGLFSYAPHYLIYNNRIVKAEAVILLVGPENAARLNKAIEVIDSSHAMFFFIPAWNKTFRSPLIPKLYREYENRSLHLLKEHGGLSTSIVKYENTHIELLKAKSMTDRQGVASAVLVGHPYQMKRIKLISDEVFNQNIYQLSFTYPCIKLDLELWWAFKDSRNWVVNEYIKLIWFIFYTIF